MAFDEVRVLAFSESEIAVDYVIGNFEGDNVSFSLADFKDLLSKMYVIGYEQATINEKNYGEKL